MRNIIGSLFIATLLTACSMNGGKPQPESGAARKFTSPGAAADALREAVAASDRQKLLGIFGSSAAGLLDSGDAVADKNAFETFSAELAKRSKVEALSEDQYVLLVGEKEWPFPVPIVSDGKTWTFDTASGKEEILDRRIGENELRTIRLARSYVDAQKEYKRKDRDGDHVLEYAQKAVSSPGKKDGLFWKSEGKEESPFGPLAAEAVKEGYQHQEGVQLPFHGYFFKILTAQGEAAPGGKKSYLDARGNMTKGFALLAYPARYGSSGIMSFIVNQDGIVYQKDLNVQTLSEAAALNEFNPDESWSPVDDERVNAVEE